MRTQAFFSSILVAVSAFGLTACTTELPGAETAATISAVNQERALDAEEAIACRAGLVVTVPEGYLHNAGGQGDAFYDAFTVPVIVSNANSDPGCFLSYPEVTVTNSGGQTTLSGLTTYGLEAGTSVVIEVEVARYSVYAPSDTALVVAVASDASGEIFASANVVELDF